MSFEDDSILVVLVVTALFIRKYKGRARVHIEIEIKSS